MNRFFAWLLLGAVASFAGVVAFFTIPIDPIAMLALLGVFVLLLARTRSLAVLSAGLLGWGIVWIVVFYVRFGMTLTGGMGHGLGAMEYLSFVGVGAAIALSGPVVGFIGLIRLRTRRIPRA